MNTLLTKNKKRFNYEKVRLRLKKKKRLLIDVVEKPIYNINGKLRSPLEVQGKERVVSPDLLGGSGTCRVNGMEVVEIPMMI